MPVVLQQCHGLPVTPDEVLRLWAAVIEARPHADDYITVRCVDSVEMQRLNSQYRHKHAPTNVLTFSYPPTNADQIGEQEHDVALCFSVAQEEAAERRMLVRDHVAQLLAHAFLHATGLDHERSEVEAREMEELEQKVLAQCGFTAQGL